MWSDLIPYVAKSVFHPAIGQFAVQKIIYGIQFQKKMLMFQL